MPRGNTAANYPEQLLYTFPAAGRILGLHPTTLFRQAKDGTLRTVETPFGRRIHRDEIRRQSGEIVDEKPSKQTDIERT
ncbi:hypothetical protein QD460_26015 [Rhizobium jaguaris]|uniref:hypothetical protein n=1 Tax=Rhizobium jaguaris TaxID=1312183 RepID=UPI0039BFF916